MVLEQIIYQTSADLWTSYHAAEESPYVENWRGTWKGLLMIQLKLRKTKVELTSKGKLMIFWESSWSNNSWKRLWRILMKQILRTAGGEQLTTPDIVWMKRFPYPGASHAETRLKAIMFDAEMDGSIESRLSVIDELVRSGRLRLRKRSLLETWGRHLATLRTN